MDIKVGKKKNVDLFEKYLIINIDDIQRKYAIKSRYEINKNLTAAGPDFYKISSNQTMINVCCVTPYIPISIFRK